MKNIKIVKEPYVNDGNFKTLNGDSISYSHLCVDVQVGDSICTLKKSLKGLEKDYVKGLIEADRLISDFEESE